MRLRVAVGIGVVAVIAVTTAVAWSRGRGPALVDCTADVAAEPVRCVMVAVRESPGKISSRTLHLRVLVLPALGASAKREPLVLLQGGPGASGTQMARNFAQRVELREGRDLVFMDQRGTAGSGALDCEFLGRFNFLGALFPVDHVTACRQALEKRADLATYTNTISADDLDAVRMALGADTWSVMGFSFGTRLAQSYARQYPAHVRAVILDGVVPFDAQLTVDLAQSMERSLDYVLTRCEQDEDCHARHPDVRNALGSVVARLESGPLRVNVTDARGRTLAGEFGRWEFAYAVRGMLYGALAARLPAMLHDAERSGDFSAFANVYWDRTRWVGDATSLALHLGVYCSEDLPFTDSTEAVRRAQGTLIGARYYQEYRAGCASWPMPRAAEGLRRPWTSDIPVLLFSGERDPVTPPEYGERVAQSLGRARHFVFRGGGHAEGSWCKTQVIASFLDNPLGTNAANTCVDLDWFPKFTVSPG